MDYLIPLIVVATASLILVDRLTRNLPERGKVVQLVAGALTLRWALCIIFYAIPAVRIFHEDAEGYEYYGTFLAKAWHGTGPSVLIDNQVNYGYTYWSALLCYLFGEYRLHVSLFNSLMSCLSAIIIYRILQSHFVETIARRALLFALFFPSMILWSSIAVKECTMVFLLVVCLYSTLALRRRISVFYLLLLSASLLGIFTIRFYMFYMTGLAIVLSLTFSSERSLSRSLTVQLLLGGVLMAAAMFWGLTQEAHEDFNTLTFERISLLRNGLAASAQSGWRADVDVSSPAKALVFMPLGVLFLLFSPFPWQFLSLRPLLTLPEMLIWWPFTAFWVRGIAYAIRTRKKELIPVFVFAVVFTIAYSTVHGNAGVAFRQRSQVMIFLFMFAAIDFEIRRRRRMGLPVESVELEWNPEAAEVPAPALPLHPRPRRVLPNSIGYAPGKR